MADFDTGLERNSANYAPLTPIDYLKRAAEVYGGKTAIVHGDMRQTWAETWQRCCQMAAALRQIAQQRGQAVAALAGN